MTRRYKSVFVSLSNFKALCDLFQTPVSVDGLAVDNAADPVLEAKYRDKLFTQVCSFVDMDKWVNEK